MPDQWERRRFRAAARNLILVVLVGLALIVMNLADAAAALAARLRGKRRP